MEKGVLQFDVISFLSSVENKIHSLEEFLEVIRQENGRAESYGQTHISELMEVSTYQWQLEQIEMKLKAPSLIKISFSTEGMHAVKAQTEEEKINDLILKIIIRLIRENGTLDQQPVI